MNKIILQFLLILIFFASASFQKVLKPKQMRKDLNFLFKTIEEVHPNMYAYISKEEFAPICERLYNSINHPMNRIEFYKLTAPVVASLKNGHTYIEPFSDFQEYIKNDGKIFSLGLNQDGESVILSDYNGPVDLSIGAEVLTIDNQNAREFLTKIARYFPAEGKAYNLALIQRKGFLPMFLWLEKGEIESLTLKIKTNDGQIKTYDIKALDYNELKSFQRKKADKNKSKTESTSKPENQRYSYRYISDCNTGLIEFDSFHEHKEFRTFLKESFSQIKQQKVTNLIIDIRNNPGGSSSVGDELLKYLTDKPFRQVKEVQIKMSRQLLKVQPDFKISHPKAKIGSIVTAEGNFRKAENNPLIFKGRVFVLIGPISASAAVDFAQAVKHYHIGTLVGRETVDTPVNYGNCVPGKLPNSGLDFRVASKYFVDVGGKPDGRGVIPDYEVKQKPEDTAKSVDTVLQFTLNLIKSGDSALNNDKANK